MKSPRIQWNRFFLAANLLLLLASAAEVGAWTNPDLESGSLTGWTASTGAGGSVVYTPSASAVAPGAAPHTQGTICVAPTICLNRVHGGNYAIELFSGRGDQDHLDYARVEQSDMVHPTNTCLSFWFSAVLSGHHFLNGEDYGSDSYILFEVLVGGTVVATQRYSFYDNLNLLVDDGANPYGGPDIPSNNPPNQWKHLPWTQFFINMAPYAGQMATIRLTAYGCDMGGHSSYGYLDDVSWVSCPSSQVNLTKTNLPTGTVNNGDNITYTLNYSNPGSIGIPGVKVCDQIPAGTSLVAGSPSSSPLVSNVTTSGGEVCWNVGYLSPGGSGSLSFQVRVDGSCDFINNTAIETDGISSGKQSNTVQNSISCPPIACDNFGTSFWLGLPDSRDPARLGEALPAGLPIYVKAYITSQVATTGTVEVPGVGYGPVPFSVAANTYTIVDLPQSAIQLQTDGITQQGIKITANDPIAVYMLAHQGWSGDFYQALPVDVLGTDYLVMAWQNRPNGNARGSLFSIVGTQPNTNVAITPRINVNGNRAANTTYNITLGVGETYQLESYWNGQDLTGTKIQSTYPVAVLGGHNCAHVPTDRDTACDHVVEQLPPVTAWGTNFVADAFATRLDGDTYKVVARDNGTTVYRGSTNLGTLNAGNYLTFNHSNDFQLTTQPAGKPVLVAQFARGQGDAIPPGPGGKGDPTMMLVTPVDQFKRTYDISTVQSPGSGSFPVNYINIKVPNQGVGTIELDGVAIPISQFDPIGSSGYSMVQKSVSVGVHRVTGPGMGLAPYPFGVEVYGFDDQDGYSFPAGGYLTTGSGTSCPPPSPAPTLCPARANPANGLVVVEAEQYNSSLVQQGRSWYPVTDIAGASGGKSMRAYPLTPSNLSVNTGYTNDSPRLDYQICFPVTGTYYVWIRGFSQPDDDSIHVGLNGSTVSTADRIHWTSLMHADWNWTNSTIDGPRATIQVNTVGVHTLNLWMRENGIRVDQILLTLNPIFSPSQAALVPSSRSCDACTAPTPTPTPSLTPTPHCVGQTAQYRDSYDNTSSFANYGLYNNAWAQNAPNAYDYQVVAGKMRVAPAAPFSSYALVSTSQFNHSMGNYSVEADFEGVSAQTFGLAFRANTASQTAYVFQWNGSSGRWEIVKKSGTGTVIVRFITNFSYAGGPIHLKVVVGPGNSICAYTIYNEIETQVFNGVVDTVPAPAPMTSGAVGVYSSNITAVDGFSIDNFDAYNCADCQSVPTYTPTPLPACASNIPGSNWTAGAVGTPIVGGGVVYTVSGDIEKMWKIGSMGVWSSPDGVAWSQVGTSVPSFLLQRSDYQTVVFDGKMWVIGGFQAGVYQNDIHWSADGLTWNQVTTTGPLFTGRRAFGLVVYNGDMWVIGGQTGTNAYSNEIWRTTSLSASTWTQVTTGTPMFSPRAGMAAVVFNGDIWVFGGYDSTIPPVAFNEAWRSTSTSGANWTQVATSGVNFQFASSQAVVCGNALWFFGGSWAQGPNRSVAVSGDGVQWSTNTNSTPFVIGGSSAAGLAFQGKVWALGSPATGSNRWTWSSDCCQIPPPAPYLARLNAGGPAYTGPYCDTWVADRLYTPGSFGKVGSLNNYDPNVVVTDPNVEEPLYEDESVGANDLEYKFDLPNQTYTVTLKFAELNFDSVNFPGARKFNIIINGVTYASNFDVAALGPYRTARDVSYTVTVTSGQLNVFLQATANPAILSAIEVKSVGYVAPPCSPNCCQVAGAASWAPPSFSGAADIAADPIHSWIYVPDSAGVVKVLNYNGSLVRNLGTPGVDFNAPHSVFFVNSGTNGTLYVLDRAGMKIKTVDPVTGVVSLFVNVPQSNLREIFVDSTGVYATSDNGVIFMYDLLGAAQPSLSGVGLNAPTGIWRDGSKLYVNDTSNNRIVSFTETAPFTYSTPPNVVVSNTPSNPLQPFGLWKLPAAGGFPDRYFVGNGSHGTVAYKVEANGSWTELGRCSPGGFVLGITVDQFGAKYMAMNPNTTLKIEPCAGGGGGFVPYLARRDPAPNLADAPLLAVRPNVSRNGEPIDFQLNLKRPGQVKLTIFTILGEKVYGNTYKVRSGLNTITWDLKNQTGSNVASGLYLYMIRLEDGKVEKGKVVVLH